MLTDRLRELEQYVREYRAKRIKWNNIDGIDGYTKGYFELKEQCERLIRVQNRGLELTLEQQEKVNNFKARQRKFNK